MNKTLRVLSCAHLRLFFSIDLSHLSQTTIIRRFPTPNTKAAKKIATNTSPQNHLASSFHHRHSNHNKAKKQRKSPTRRYSKTYPTPKHGFLAHFYQSQDTFAVASETIPANIFQSLSWRIFNLNFFSQCGAHASPMGDFNFLN